MDYDKCKKMRDQMGYGTANGTICTDEIKFLEFACFVSIFDSSLNVKNCKLLYIK